MNKSKLLVSALLVALVASVCVNIYFSAFAGSQEVSEETKLEMVSSMQQAQVKVDNELNKIGAALITASQQLSITGISGAQAHTVVAALAANSTYVVDAATQDLNNIMVTVEPPAFQNAVGKDIGKQSWLNPNPNGVITPMMTTILPLVENNTGVAIAAPVFNANKVMIGTVSVTLKPQTLLADCITSVTEDKTYGFTVMQTNGLIIYDSDPTQTGKNTFTDPTYAGYTSLLSLAHQIAASTSGHGTYTFTVVSSGQPGPKECYWTTVDAFGQNWRLAVFYPRD